MCRRRRRGVIIVHRLASHDLAVDRELRHSDLPGLETPFRPCFCPGIYLHHVAVDGMRSPFGPERAPTVRHIAGNGAVRGNGSLAAVHGQLEDLCFLFPEAGPVLQKLPVGGFRFRALHHFAVQPLFEIVGSEADHKRRQIVVPHRGVEPAIRGIEFTLGGRTQRDSSQGDRRRAQRCDAEDPSGRFQILPPARCALRFSEPAARKKRRESSVGQRLTGF